jgi:hypothetical protein
MTQQKRFWLTPPDLYAKLDNEFHFDFDPCPFPRPETFNGITVPWGYSNYCNPPFRKSDGAFDAGPTAFIRKAIEEKREGKTSVIVLNTMSYINLLIEAGAEFRSLGRLCWLDCDTKEPRKSPANTTMFILRGDA